MEEQEKENVKQSPSIKKKSSGNPVNSLAVRNIAKTLRHIGPGGIRKAGGCSRCKR